MSLAPELTQPAHAIAAALLRRGETVAVAESSAGGLISAALLTVPGASGFYLGGTIIYTVEAARALLSGVVERPAGARGASEPFARYLASAVADKLGATWAVSETGATGPAGNRYGDPPGHAWVAVAGPNGVGATAHVLTGSDNREHNMGAFAVAALDLLVATLSE